MSNQPQPSLDALRLAIHGVSAPFSVEGTFVPEKHVALVFKDRARIEVQRAKNSYEQARESQALINHCKPAPFGHKKKTRYDTTVRDALQLKAEDGAFSVENFDPVSSGVLQQVQRALVPHDPNPISAELYTLNVYGDGGHFAPHKDTPRGNDMFGTLVVCLPSQFYRGELVLTHRGIVQKFDWARAIEKQQEPKQLHWAAFFGDVDHQITRLWSGVRVTLSYNLRRGAGGSSLTTAIEDPAPLIREAWQALLADPNFLPEGGIIGYPCCHLYHQDARFQQTQTPITPESLATLKGRDHLTAATALAAGLTVTFTPYMFETCADETWQLDRFPTGKESSRLPARMDPDKLRARLPIRASSEEEGDFGVIWIDPPPTIDRSTWRSEDEQDAQMPTASLLHSCEYSGTGYFGNEGSETDLYTYAALHIEVPPAGAGARAAKEQAKPTTDKPKPKRSPRKRKTDQE